MRVRHLLRRLGGSSGQATVEFALLVPVLCIILLLSVDLGRALLSWLDATHLANMGARLAAVNSGPPSGTTLPQWILSEALSKDMRDPSATKVCIAFPPNEQTGTSGQKGDPVRVSVLVDYHVVSIPFMDVSGPTWTLKGASTMRLEQTPSYGEGCSS